MDLLKAFEELCADEGPVGEMATQIGLCLFEGGHKIADALDDLAEKLGEIETGFAEDEEESCWDVDRLDPEFESTSGLLALRNAVDSIVNFCDNASNVINNASMSFMADKEE